PPLAGQEVLQLVVDQREEPAAECASLRVIFEATRRRCDLAQNVLGQVSRVAILDPALAGIAINQRRIKLYEFLPGQGVPRVADANQQARPREGRIWHGLVPSIKYYRGSLRV